MKRCLTTIENCFIGFSLTSQPSWAKGLCRRTLLKHPEFEILSDIIHGKVADGFVDGIFKADSYLKNFHGGHDKSEVKQDITYDKPYLPMKEGSN